MRFPDNLWACVLGTVLIAGTALFAIPGYLTWDSGTYHLMVRTLSETGGFTNPNGFADLSSPLLAVGQTIARDGRLVSQYPEFYTLISIPFYALFGYRGFMVLNAVAFVGICTIIWRSARWFSDDRRAPLVAVVVYALATYAIEFTQSSYPHLTSTFLVCASIWLVWGVALQREDIPAAPPAIVRAAEGRCALAGFIFGIAVGVRLDSIFAGLALALPFLTFRTLGWRTMAACAFGSLPPLLGLAWINAVKFGEFIPFSYGRADGGSTSSVVTYFPVAGAIAVAVAFLVWNRYRPVRLGRRGVAVVVIAIVLGLVLTPFGQRLLNGVFQLLVDMRIRPGHPEPALSRSAGGAVVYHGSVKKALLESCPYLILIVIPAVRGVLSGTYGVRWLLWLVPAGFIGFYGYLAWHGSVGWNMRYFNPALPFLAILASHELLRVLDDVPTRHWLFWTGVAALWAILAVVFFFLHIHLDLQEVVVLNGGLLIAALLLICQVAAMLAPHVLPKMRHRAFAALFVLALVWSSALAVGSDFSLSASVRYAYLRVARDIEPYIQDRALIVTYQPNGIWALLESGKAPVIAHYYLGKPEDVVALVEKAAGSRPVYLHSLAQDKDTVAAVVLEALRPQGIRAERLLDATDKRPYDLYRLRKTSDTAARK